MIVQDLAGESAHLLERTEVGDVRRQPFVSERIAYLSLCRLEFHCIAPIQKEASATRRARLHDLLAEAVGRAVTRTTHAPGVASQRSELGIGSD